MFIIKPHIFKITLASGNFFDFCLVLRRSPVDRVKSSKLKVEGALYDINSGSVT